VHRALDGDKITQGFGSEIQEVVFGQAKYLWFICDMSW